MNTRERIKCIRLAEKLEKKPNLKKELGIDVTIHKNRK